MAKSGTCILELALLGTPTIVVYAISKLDVFIAQKIFQIKLPFYSLPNIILNKEMFKELYGPYLTQEMLVQSYEKATLNLDNIAKDSSELKHLFGPQDPGYYLAKQLTINL